MKMENKKLKKLLMLGVIGLCLLLIIYFLKNSILLDLNYLQSLIESSGIWAPIVFAILYILITIFGISAAIFTVLAGTIFGTLKGLIIVVISATVSGTIAFYIARNFRDKFISKEKNSTKKSILANLITRIELASEKNGFQIIAILRLSFLPYIPLSYAAGLVKKLKAIDFILATFITNIFGSFFFIYFGDRLSEIISGNMQVSTISTLIGSIIMLVLFIVFVPKLINKFMKNKIGEKIK
jgi:uncharacterized membrane protein YdjX (TVP38/TMEM64 family)